MRNGELAKSRIGLSYRQIVEGIHRAREIRCSHRIANEADANATSVPGKEIAHDTGKIGSWNDLVEQVCGRVSKSRAKTVDRLILLRLVHGHDVFCGTGQRGGEGDAGLGRL